jgi:hypothetical protein
MTQTIEAMITEAMVSERAAALATLLQHARRDLQALADLVGSGDDDDGSIRADHVTFISEALEALSNEWEALVERL